MNRAFTIASDPRSWRAWSALAALVAVLSAVLSGVAAAGGQQLPAFWVLWAVLAAGGPAPLTVRPCGVSRYAAGERRVKDGAGLARRGRHAPGGGAAR